MMTVLCVLAELAAICGFFAFGLKASSTVLGPVVSDLRPRSTDDDRLGYAVLIVGVAWVFAFGARGWVASCCYYVGIAAPWSFLIMGVAGGGLLLACSPALISAWRAGRWPVRFAGFIYYAWPGLGLLLIAIIIHLMHIAPAWNDQDEVTVYGFVSKLISQGWTFKDIASVWGEIHAGPKLVETVDSSQIFIAGDTWLVRLSRVFNLLATACVATGFLSAVGCRLSHGFLAGACLILTPELHYLGTSLKVDAVLMSIEFSALCVMALAWLSRHVGKAADVLRAAVFGFVLALMAASVRQSGLYAVMLGIVLSALLLWCNRFSVSRTQVFKLVLICAALGGIAAVGYWANWLHYGNPIFPFKAPLWLSGLPHITTLESYRESLNIRAPHGVLQLYLIPHLALGLELRDFPFTLHAEIRQSMGWLNPTLLALFIVPLAWRNSVVRVLSTLFLFQFVIWSFGVHYSRVFHGSAGLMVVCCAYMAQMQGANGLFQRIASFSSRTLLYSTLVLVFLLQARWAWIHFPDDFSEVMTAEGRYRDSVKVLERWYPVSSLPDQADIKEMEKLFPGDSRFMVGVCSSVGRAIHILFGRGFFVGLPFESIPATYYALVGPDAEGPPPSYDTLIYTSKDGAWKLYERPKRRTEKVKD